MKKPGTPASEDCSEKGSAGVSVEGEAAGCLERGPCAAPSPGTASPEEPPLLPELRFDGRDAEGWLGVALWENCVWTCGAPTSGGRPLQDLLRPGPGHPKRY